MQQDSTAPTTPDMTDHSCDVLIIGGGPAGATAAILLRELGHDVVVLEKDKHPRFHIGESLLPANLPLLERLGVAQAVQAIGMPKLGAEFVSPWHEHRQTYLFADTWDHTHSHAYQVRRSEFDHILIERARTVGARVFEQCEVTDVQFTGPICRVAARADGALTRWHAQFVLDASGRDTFLAARLGLKRRNPRHNSAAIFAHFTGVTRYPGDAAGHITIYWFDHGWFWVIPLADGATSVGAVVWPYYLKQRRADLQSFLLETIALSPALSERMAGAVLQSEVQATGNYSYSATRTHGERYLLLGDAYAFIDPVFSSGVWLAMRSAEVGAGTVDQILRDPRTAHRALRNFDAQMRLGPRVFAWFIYRITTPAMRQLFMNPSNALRMKEALLSMLAGDIYGTVPIWSRLRVFKALYYAATALSPMRALQAQRRRRARRAALAPTQI